MYIVAFKIMVHCYQQVLWWRHSYLDCPFRAECSYERLISAGKIGLAETTNVWLITCSRWCQVPQTMPHTGNRQVPKKYWVAYLGLVVLFFHLSYIVENYVLIASHRLTRWLVSALSNRNVHFLDWFSQYLERDSWVNKTRVANTHCRKPNCRLWLND